jgi:hypothetical protein
MLLFNALPNTLNGLFENYSGINVIFACKIAASSGQTFGLTSYGLMCLAAIDQCFSTSTNQRYKGISASFKRRLILICISICILHGIPFLIYYDVQTLPGTNTTTCSLTDSNGYFSKYLIYFAVPILGGILPVSIMGVCALIALHNIRNMRKQRVHVIRLRSEQQLTSMILIKILSVCLIVVPFLISYVIRYIMSFHSKDPLVQKKLLLAGRVITFLWFTNYAVSNLIRIIREMIFLF